MQGDGKKEKVTEPGEREERGERREGREGVTALNPMGVKCDSVTVARTQMWFIPHCIH